MLRFGLRNFVSNITLCLLLSVPASLIAQPAAMHPATSKSEPIGAPLKLQTDNLLNPLGLDDVAPHFAWQLSDGRRGAKQSAFQIQVATHRELLASGKPDAWDSGRINSGESLGIAYAGKALTASTRYYWRVLAWDKDGKPYPASEASWWETGLLSQSAWQAKWIGYQQWDEAAVRTAGAQWVASPDGSQFPKVATDQHRIAYRMPFSIGQQVKHAALYVTGQDVASAWVNGTQVATGAVLPPWHQLPWKKYVRIDITPQIKTGANLLAIEVTHYIVNSNGFAAVDNAPMSATLVAELADGSIWKFASKPGPEIIASIQPGQGWQSAAEVANASSWKPVIAFVADPGPDSGLPGNPWPSESVKSLRDEFTIHKKVASARLYATALGAYQIFINGKRAGDQVLSPGWTDFRLRFKYQTYDVTADLAAGKNAIAALLAPGWYSTPLQWFQQPNVYGDAPPSLLAQLRIEYSDGSVEWLVSDSNWKADVSPTLKAEIYDGETQDARLIQPGWNLVNFAAKGWKPAEIHTPDLAGIQIDGQDFQPIRVERELTPKAMTEPAPGVYIFDMGQNFSGVESLRLNGPSGTDVRVRTGEILNADGTLYTENLRTAKSTDHFILSGKGIETFEPQFTYHGFRYLELTGLKAKPTIADVRGIVFHTDAPFTAQLKTGSPMLNSLWSNILWGQRSNFVGVPTDCPQRDERLGWTADAQVFWRTASFNMDLAAFSRKFTGDIRGTQVGSGAGATAGDMFGIFAPGVSTTSSASGAGWSDAGVIIPWTSWIQTGDTSVVQQNWDAMTKYLAAIESTNPDYLWKNNAGIPFGDWLSPEGPTRFPLVATASWAYDVTLMQQMAHALGKAEDEAHYAALFAKIKEAFGKAFIHAGGFVAGEDDGPSPFGAINNPNAKAKGGDTQTGYVLALHMNLAPDNLRKAIGDKLAAKIEANHGLLGTGFLGTPYLLSVLVDTGHRDLAYHLLLNTQYPSWGYLVGHGATTMWERWNGDQMKSDPSMNSYNHYAYGAVADWIYRYAAGIDTTSTDAGFHTIRLHPAFDSQLGSIDFSYPSPYGQIRSAWTIHNGTAHWTVTIPANASGWLPLTEGEAAHYKIGGAGIEKSTAIARGSDAEPGYLLAAGTYVFDVDGVQ
jgi:alpha-L-rhamnosidase